MGRILGPPEATVARRDVSRYIPDTSLQTDQSVHILASPAKKQRVVDCVKILLDVAKESSDWFPPLKSALGGVYALINHYEVFVGIDGYHPQLIYSSVAI